MERMNKIRRTDMITLASLWAPTMLVFIAASSSVPTFAQVPLRLVERIKLPDVQGRIDHMDVDVAGRRLFVAALGNNSVEVVDLNRKTVVHRITGLDEPQGIRYIPKSRRIVIANGGDGSVRVFDGSTFAEVKQISYSGDADNVRYDASMDRIYVGFGDGALGIIDAVTFKEIGTISLPGHPESFQIDQAGPRIFVNVPAARQIVVLDAQKLERISSIPLPDESSNYPMALDPEHHLLFVGTRKPARFLAFDTQSLHLLSKVSIDGDTDDLFCDSRSNSQYVSCGSGYVDVVELQAPARLTVTSRIPTAAGARTSFLAPQLNQFLLAVPHRGAQEAALWVYDTRP